jgi:hypothetical protein
MDLKKARNSKNANNSSDANNKQQQGGRNVCTAELPATVWQSATHEFSRIFTKKSSEGRKICQKAIKRPNFALFVRYISLF